ncbi:MAG TPA: carboxypeptidase-like regulatory domain-containing protein [Bryobacteraceae bacterium]
MPRVIAPVLLLTSLGFAQTTGSVEGVVVDRVTGAGIPGASVTFYIRTQQGAIVDATTDASGDFRIFGMKPGSYEVRFEKEGYRFGNKIPPQPYIVGESPSPVRIRLEMTRLITLSGRVVDPDGNPVSQGEVRLVNRNTVPIAADGTFTFKELEPGSYTITAIPKPTRAAEGARVPVLTRSSEPVVVRGDVDVSGYEIRLETAEVYRVSGVVLDESGDPKPRVLVQLLPRIQAGTRAIGGGIAGGDFMTFVGPGPSLGPQEAQVISAEDGSFEFPTVRSGEWQLATGLAGQIQTSPSTFINTFHNGATAVIVGNHSVENLQIRQVLTFKMSATIDWNGSAPSRVAKISLASTDGRSAAVIRSLAIDPNGTLDFPAVTPGQYLILPQAGPGFYPVSVLLGGQEVLGKPVDLFPGSTLRVTYKAAPGSVQGTVANGDGTTVFLVPDKVQTIGFGRMVTPKADGAFDMSGVPPGDYFVAALMWPQGLIPRVDEKWIARLAEIGTRISVAQGMATVQLKANPWEQ